MSHSVSSATRSFSVWNQVKRVSVRTGPVTKHVWNWVDRCVGRYCHCRHQERSVARCVLMEWPACVLLGTGWGQGLRSGVRRWGVCVIGNGLDRVSGWRHRVVWGLEGIQRCLCYVALLALDARASANQFTGTVWVKDTQMNFYINIWGCLVFILCCWHVFAISSLWDERWPPVTSQVLDLSRQPSNLCYYCTNWERWAVKCLDLMCAHTHLHTINHVT